MPRRTKLLRRKTKEWLRRERFDYRSDVAIKARELQHAIATSWQQANNERIVDRQDKRNQASGKMKRAGVFATKLRGG